MALRFVYKVLWVWVAGFRGFSRFQCVLGASDL